MPEPAVKAIALALGDKLTQELSTPEAYARYFAALPKEMQEIARRPLPAGAWVPLLMYYRDNGTCRAVRKGEREVEVHHEGIAFPSREIACLGVSGSEALAPELPALRADQTQRGGYGRNTTHCRLGSAVGSSPRPLDQGAREKFPVLREMRSPTRHASALTHG